MRFTAPPVLHLLSETVCMDSPLSAKGWSRRRRNALKAQRPTAIKRII